MNAVTVTAKGWAKSKTIVVNGLVAVALASDQLVELVSASDLFPDRLLARLLFGLAIINIFFRSGTTQPVASTPIQDQSKVLAVDKPRLP